MTLTENEKRKILDIAFSEAYYRYPLIVENFSGIWDKKFFFQKQGIYSRKKKRKNRDRLGFRKFLAQIFDPIPIDAPSNIFN